MISSLAARFLPLFPTQGPEIYSGEIIQTALATPSTIPQFHERLLDGYAKAPDRGSASQFFSAAAIEHVFRFNAMVTSSGSYDNALLQSALLLAITDGDRNRGGTALQEILGAMGSGLDRFSLEKSLRQIGNGAPISRHLVERRCKSILAAQDLHAKLLDLADNDPETDTVEFVGTLSRSGWSPERIGERINGTSHTGYLSNQRLAGRVAAVLSEIGRIKDTGRVAATQRRLQQSFSRLAIPGRKLDAEFLTLLLQEMATPQTQSFLGDRGGFEIEMVSGKNGTPDGTVAFFRKGMQKGERDRVLIRESSTWDLTTRECRETAYNETVDRLVSLIHEWEHWRHFSKDPIFRSVANRHDRVTSEVMALLEEHRFRAWIGNSNFDRVASALGVSLTQFLRDFADWSYFKMENASLSLGA